MINSNDLSTLFTSTRRDAQSLLPHLVRRLFVATAASRDIEAIHMASGDDIRLHGWDGLVNYSGTHAYIPPGSSAWEMGVSADPRSKANRDYANRTGDPRNVSRSDSTFVFVTPHVWDGREVWIAEKKAEGIWKDVIAIDGSILAEWLESAPVVARWIANQLGRSIDGIQTVEDEWQGAIASMHCPDLSPEIVLGGREAAWDQLLAFLQEPSGDLTVAGSTPEEALLFTLATCMEKRNTSAKLDTSRILVLSDIKASEHLATLLEDHIAILKDPALAARLQSDQLSHLHAIIPAQIGALPSSRASSIAIGPLVRNNTARALETIGYSERQANALSGESKGSLHALLWLLAEPESGALEWATGQPASELAPLVLAGQWTISQHDDHDVVAHLAQCDYSEIRQTLAEWCGANKPLIRRGTIWDWKAWRFAWSRLAGSMESTDIRRFLQIAEQVLGAADPALELPPEERWLAAIRGKVHKYSHELREGLAQSLVLLALHDDLLQDFNGQAAVNNFVGSLLRADDLARRWISIARWLPDLAEAAPDAFLDALDVLVDDQDAVDQLFIEGGMFGSSPHTHLLWALERLAWSDDHFGRTILALGKLAAVDPGGNLQNRPSNSLRDILLPWSTATMVGLDDRIIVVRLLLDNISDVGWDCASSLLPHSQQFCATPNRPKWRQWVKEANDRILLRDYWSFQERLIELLLAHAGNDGARWTKLLEASPDLLSDHPDLGNRVLQALLELDVSVLSREAAFTLGDAARALVMRHELGAHTEWAMKNEELVPFRAIADHLRAHDPRDVHRWLFTRWPEISRDIQLSHEEREQQLAEHRASAIEAILVEHEFDALLEWANEIEFPESLGHTLAQRELAIEQEQKLLHDGIANTGTASERPSAARLASGYINTKTNITEDFWKNSTLEWVRNTLDHRATAYFLICLNSSEETWRIVDDMDAQVQQIYWDQVWFVVLNLEQCEIAVPRLLAANRSFKAIDVMGMLIHQRTRAEWNREEQDRALALTREVLNATLDHSPQDEFGIDNTLGYTVDGLISYAESLGTSIEELAVWEWKWMPLIEDESRGIRSLQAELANNPQLFVDLLRALYKPDDQDENQQAQDADPEINPETKQRAEMAYNVLKAWTRVPGLDAQASPLKRHEIPDGIAPVTPAWNGSVDRDALSSYIDRALHQAAESNHQTICYQHLGQVLAFAPANPDGTWPCTAVCAAIERVSSDDLERGMHNSVFNRRGAYFADREGKQERSMASTFRKWCESVRIEYPRTGKLLRLLAEGYEEEADRRIRQTKIEEYND